MAREVDTGFNPAFGGLMQKLQAAAAAQGIKTHFISGVRSAEDQRQLYANAQAYHAGRPLPYPERGAVNVAAKPGTSLHERGFAADLVADDPGQQAKLRALGNQLGLRTLGPSDPNHFELSKTMIASAPKGTTINAATTPVAGALAKQETGPESVGAAPAAAASEGPLDTRQLVYNKLVAAGLQPHQALGALWSLGGESGGQLNTGAYNPKDPGGAVGIAQWNQDRRTALEAFAKARGTSWTDPATQADYLVDELTNAKSPTYQGGVLDAMRKAKTAEDATRVWTAKFERPRVDNSDVRIARGKAVGTLDDKGQFALGTAPASVGGGTAVASAAPATAPPAANQPWWSKFTEPPTDAQGKPLEGAKSPVEKAIDAFTGSSNLKARMEAQAPAGDGSWAQGPGARNVSPGLQNIAQTYGQTLNSLMQPLTWSSAPPGNAGMRGGFQGGAAGVPGVSLNSIQPISENLGFGIGSNYGLG